MPGRAPPCCSWPPARPFLVARHPITVLTERQALTSASLPLPRQRFSTRLVTECTPLPAATGIAQSARPVPHTAGWRHARPTCCLSSTSTSSSRFPHPSAPSPGTTNGSSTACCSTSPLTRCVRSPGIPGISAPRSAPRSYCTPGARRSRIIRMCTASFPVAGCRLTVSAGSPAAPAPLPRGTPVGSPPWRPAVLRRGYRAR
jgi:hypothetical protein